ncbi:MAG: M48 family metallopeptidase [Chitinophagales bacterium]|nr:M48 family metallopeptidase [Chitinophagales bacterium]
MSNYITSILDKILANEPDVRKEVNVFVTRYDIPNAATFVDGTIVFNLPLLKLLENEAQIAFVLCHEIAHYKLKHSLKQFEYSLSLNGKDDKLNIEEDFENYLKALSYSREQELEADREGFKLFKELGYNQTAALQVMNILDSIENGINREFVDLSELFNADSAVFYKEKSTVLKTREPEVKTTVKAVRNEEKETSSIETFEEAEVDSSKIASEDVLSTHPDIKVRIDSLIMESHVDTLDNQPYFLISEQGFYFI